VLSPAGAAGVPCSKSEISLRNIFHHIHKIQQLATNTCLLIAEIYNKYDVMWCDNMSYRITPNVQMHWYLRYYWQRAVPNLIVQFH
jgi:hypothetical protein